MVFRPWAYFKCLLIAVDVGGFILLLAQNVAKELELL